jgi:hypothetical protein
VIASKKDKAWMRRLEKCLKEIPEGRCIRVSVMAGNTSTIGMLSEEINDTLDNDDADRMGLGMSCHYVCDFDAAHVIADSECI